MGSGAPIIMGNMTDVEMTAQLERQALENDRMLAEAARQTAELEQQIARQDQEMQALVEQQAREREINLAQAQKKLGVELAALSEDSKESDLAVDYSALEAALTKGLGSTDNSIRPV
jgi:molecular chaperone GrpE (heat shock protein)